MWIQLNMLKLNDDKTEVLLIGSNNSFNTQSTVSVRVGYASVISGQSVTNLGCIFDSRLNMNDFITKNVSQPSSIFHQYIEPAYISQLMQQNLLSMLLSRLAWIMQTLFYMVHHKVSSTDFRKFKILLHV